MLLFNKKQLKKLESHYTYLSELVRKTEESYLPICKLCGSEDTALVVDNRNNDYDPIIGATTKIYVAQHGYYGTEDLYQCNICNFPFRPGVRKEWRIGRYADTPLTALAIRRLLMRWAFGESPDPWLEFPQKLCCFRFGEEKKALPIGALKILWSWDNRLFTRSCIRCGVLAYAVAFGGTQRRSFYRYTCMACNASWTMGGNDGSAGVARVLQNSPLNCYPFRMTGRNTDGKVSSDGAALLRELGISGGLESLDQPITNQNGSSATGKPLDANRRIA